MAVGDEICNGVITPGRTVDDLNRLFAELAVDTRSQYAYTNTLVAESEGGAIMGLLIGYDGAELLPRREYFFAKAREIMGTDYTDMPPETDPGEYYIDTLGIYPAYRRQGVAHRLLYAAIARARKIGKPAGLLADMNNTRALSLYRSIGFRTVNNRIFIDTEMYHMQYMEQQ
jgi:DNA-3-methyladenine glycosylase I